MNADWDEARLLAYIADGIEESQTLEYKGADSLGRPNSLKDEITKDVSAMANAAGGVLIYGMSEYREPDKKHLPEKLDAINRQEFSREWLEQVIGNIHPRISEVIISPVTLSSGPNHVAYN
jgi:predicted HTH transcriptional regulator